MRDATSGSVGVLAVSMNNTLWRRTGISPKNPIGEEWQMITTNCKFSLVSISYLPFVDQRQLNVQPSVFIKKIQANSYWFLWLYDILQR